MSSNNLINTTTTTTTNTTNQNNEKFRDAFQRNRNRQESLLKRLVGLFVYIFCEIIKTARMLVERTIKLYYRLTRHTCELQRICAQELVASIRIKKIERSLLQSSNEFVKNNLVLNGQVALKPNFDDEEELIYQLIKAKNVKFDPMFVFKMKDALKKLAAYRQLVQEVEDLRSTTYLPESDASMLVDIWNGLRSSEPIEAVVSSKSWTELGFQGNDPSTDFRGMGMLGLTCLHFLVTNFNEIARNLYSHSLNPNYGYHFAIVSINVTSWTYKLLVDGDLKAHFYNSSRFIETNRMRLEHFFRIYIIFFIEFNDYWLFRKTSIMQFEQETKLFCMQLKEKLKNEAVVRIDEACLDDKEYVRNRILLSNKDE